jgi:ribosomal protein S18 acetylase RimI-like enzyme
MQLSPPFRRATPDDAQTMAELVNMAGDGLPLYLWGKLAQPGEDAWEVGRRRARRDSGSFSYVNTVMLEQKGRPVACLIGYRLPDTPEPIDYEKMPAMFVGMQELENLAPKTWYVNVVATYPELRGKGLGTSLLSVAEDIAIDTGASGMSIIVADSNAGARRLYARTGYREAATRRAVKESWKSPAENWVLLVKDF